MRRANTAAEAVRLAALAEANEHRHGMDRVFRVGDFVSDHFDAPAPLFTVIGENTVPTAAFGLFMLLARMGAERVESTAAGIGVLAARGTGAKAQALLYRRGGDAPVRIRVRFAGLPARLLRLPARVYRIDAANSPFEAWEAAGKPRPALRKLGETLAGSAPLVPSEEKDGVNVNAGEALVEVDLPPDSVVLVTLGAEPSIAASLCPRAQRLRRAEDEFGRAAAFLRERNPERAVEALSGIRSRYADTYWREAALYSLTGLYDLDLRSPEDAEAARRDLLLLPLDEFMRARVLARLRVDAVRKGDAAGAERIAKELDDIGQRLAHQRRWDLRRYTGGTPGPLQESNQ